MFRINFLIGLGLVLLAGGSKAGEPPTQPATQPVYDLSQVKGMSYFVGSNAAKDLLTKNGFVVTDQQFRQIFSAYIDNPETDHPLPKFITTDSSWHTYHVLLEDGVRQMEEIQASRLRTFSRRLVQLTKEHAQTNPDAWKPLVDYASIGLAWQDSEFARKLPEPLGKILQSLHDGQGAVHLDIGFPQLPASFAPRSFYGQSQALSGYMAARQWYGLVAFRLANDRETELAFRLTLLVAGDRELYELWNKLSQPYGELVGPADDGSVAEYLATARITDGGSSPDRPGPLAPLQAALQKSLPSPQVNDQLLTLQEYPHFSELTRGFRLLPLRRLPCAVVFQNTTDPKLKGRPMPSGLDFLVACKTLRSPAAVQALHQQSPQFSGEIAKTTCLVLPRSLHGQAMELLGELTKPLPASAPAALQTPAWQDKQVWTQLGAWAEMRHTWALHAKLNVMFFGGAEGTPGMVSPYPDFFEKLCALCQSTAKILAPHLVQQLDIRETATQLVEDIELWRRFNQQNQDKPASKPMEDMNSIETRLDKISTFVWKNCAAPMKVQPPDAYDEAVKLMGVLENKAREWARTGTAAVEDQKVLELYAQPSRDTVKLLNEFAEVNHTLAELARKQLKGIAFSDKDLGYIKNYGPLLAKFHFYDGNSYLEPRDDFPMVCPVFVSPPGNRNEVLYAGLSRPQALYVIAETGGKKQLYLGAVLSYREFTQEAGPPLSDKAWMEKVAKDQIQPPPAFTDNFRSGITKEDVVRLLQAGTIYPDIKHVPGAEITREMIRQLENGKYPEKKDLGKHYPDHLARHLRQRITPEDLDDVFHLFCVFPANEDSYVFAMVGIALKSLPWDKHAAGLQQLVDDSDSPNRSYVATQLLCNKPGLIDVQHLVQGYDQRSLRAKRLYCLLLGMAEKYDPGVQAVLLKALQDKVPGLRAEAAKAISRIKPKDERLIAALQVRVREDNEDVSKAAVEALLGMNAFESAPVFLERLKKLISKEKDSSITDDNENDPSIWGVTFNNSDIAPSKWWDEEHFGSLGEALITALGRFRYQPAREVMEKLTTQGQWSNYAMKSLRELDPAGNTKRLLAIALDTKLEYFPRREAIELLAESRDLEAARQLLSLLEDKTETNHTVNNYRVLICDLAANAIGAITGLSGLGGRENMSYHVDEPAKPGLLEAIKKWQIGGATQPANTIPASSQPTDRQPGANQQKTETP